MGVEMSCRRTCRMARIRAVGVAAECCAVGLWLSVVRNTTKRESDGDWQCSDLVDDRMRKRALAHYLSTFAAESVRECESRCAMAMLVCGVAAPRRPKRSSVAPRL